MDFRTESVSSLADRVRRGEISARDLVVHALSRIEAINPQLNAFVAVDGERALAAAASIDQQVASGSNPGPLAGIPIGVKDLEDATGFVTTQGSVLFADAQPARVDSPLVARLTAAGCVVMGKTNVPELGWKPDTDNALFGPTLNPWNLEHSAGGSSGGSAAAIASGMVPLATGSDGGGSIRIPAACCGLSGMKTSLGRVPMGGAGAPAWPYLSTKGPMARQMADVVAALEVTVGPDPTDLNSLPRAEASWTAAIQDPQLPARVAWSPDLGYGEVDAEVLAICQRAVDKMASMGTEVIEVDTIFHEDPLDDWLVLIGAYSLRTLEVHRDAAGWDRVDPILKMLVDGAVPLSALDIVHAEDNCHRLNLRLVELFHDVRLLITPTMAAAAPPRSLEGAAMINGTATLNWVQFTYPFNMTRSPVATVCAGLTEAGIPVGLQLVGPQHGDLVVLRSAAAMEDAIGFDELAPL